jgi:hypothetical protein
VLDATEVEDEGSAGVLPAELETSESSVAKVEP